MGRKADKRAARLAAALEREWWATAAKAWVHADYPSINGAEDAQVQGGVDSTVALV